MRPKARWSRSLAPAQDLALLKLAESSADALTYAAYPPEGAEAERMVAEVGRRFGLKISRRSRRGSPIRAAMIKRSSARSCRSSHCTSTSPQAPKELDHDAIDAIGADLPEGEVHLADLALAGRLNDLAAELGQLPRGRGHSGGSGVAAAATGWLRPGARIERGESPDAVMTSLGRACSGRINRWYPACSSCGIRGGWRRLPERAGART
jgi:DNA polymerase-3 subunit delta